MEGWPTGDVRRDGSRRPTPAWNEATSGHGRASGEAGHKGAETAKVRLEGVPEDTACSGDTWGVEM